MHKRGNVCCGDANARVEEKVDESAFKFKEVLHCRKISVVLVYDFAKFKNCCNCRTSEMIAGHFLCRTRGRKRGKTRRRRGMKREYKNLQRRFKKLPVVEKR